MQSHTEAYKTTVDIILPPDKQALCTKLANSLYNVVNQHRSGQFVAKYVNETEGNGNETCETLAKISTKWRMDRSASSGASTFGCPYYRVSGPSQEVRKPFILQWRLQ
ncbi:hypothetical protein TNCT_262781 [Trichonephila clavata]|uniref:Uncharacterized protein n=1 Tax=Trichonephila clavata TaxID=2740835 RepID=A0A8X6FDF4_TRICU|nr:hypothetical protein TNCT_262781 [Trichonephila clavata]